MCNDSPYSNIFAVFTAEFSHNPVFLFRRVPRGHRAVIFFGGIGCTAPFSLAGFIFAVFAFDFSAEFSHNPVFLFRHVPRGHRAVIFLGGTGCAAGGCGGGDDDPLTITRRLDGVRESGVM